VTYRGHTALVTALSWSPDGQKVVSSQGLVFGKKENSGLVQVWDASTGAALLTYDGHDSTTGADTTVLDVAWAPDGKWIASSSRDETVQVWDATTGARLLTYRANPPQTMGTAEWSPDGTRIASLVGGGSTVHIWGVMTGTLLVTIPGDGAITLASRWSPDGTRLATCGDSGAYVWDTTTGKQLLAYRGHGIAAVDDLAWSPDGKRIASDALDVQVWEATTGERLLTYHQSAATNEFFQLAWAPDGKRLAVCSSDSTVQIIQAS
jgi:WD40 repeat protein